MIEFSMELRGYTIPVYTLNTVVVGSGAAGYNAARRLRQYGQRDIALVTEYINAGTSRNTGSDKQTYYKLTLSGGEPDSVAEMAGTLFSGQCMDGDNAQCEAALSAQCFLSLVEAGVPFPRNRYGEYIGYKTDHDPRRRATSIGPYTSRRMTECLQAQVEEKGIPVLDKLQVVRILTDGGRACGLLCLNLAKPGEAEGGFVVFHCRNIVWATGGPAGMYADSVYPHGHYGASGLAFEAGALGQNLTEWQYGLASVKPRWNVSGTYMQVLPRFVSTDENGQDEREFLFDFFADTADCLSKVFLKGYQWPFDVRKVKDGSSIIDILVHIEKGKGRRVFLDFRSNPLGQSVDFETLSPEAADYLKKAEACFGTPIERLLHMNEPAVAFYRERGVDLERDMLEIALCAQHNNGGIAVDSWWQSTLPGLFTAALALPSAATRIFSAPGRRQKRPRSGSPPAVLPAGGRICPACTACGICSSVSRSISAPWWTILSAAARAGAAPCIPTLRVRRHTPLCPPPLPSLWMTAAGAIRSSRPAGPVACAPAPGAWCAPSPTRTISLKTCGGRIARTKTFIRGAGK